MNAHTRKDIKGNIYQEISLNSQDFQQTSGGHRLAMKLLLILCGSLATFLAGMTSFLAGGAEGYILNLTKDCQCPAFIAINFILYFSSLFYVAAFGIDLKLFFSVFSLISLGTLVITFLEKKEIIFSLFFTGIGIAFAVAAALLTAYLITLNFKIAPISYYLTISLISLNVILSTVFNLPEPLKSGVIVCDLAAIITGTIIAHKALKGDPKFTWIKETAIFWAATGGTSFYGVDLTDVSFDNSHLPHTDFRNTILTRTSFKNVTGLELSRLQGTILEDPKVRRLLTHSQEGWRGEYPQANLTGANLIKANLTQANLKQAQLTGAVLTDILLSEANLTDANLTGANLTRAKLEGANLKGANLNGANLHKADLMGAILTEINALDTDFSGATLTDTCIQGWNINKNTCFKNVICKRIFLKCEQQGNIIKLSQQKPDGGEFQEGEFEKWITEIQNTVDLIFQNGLNWKAFAFSLAQTAIDHPGLDLSRYSLQNKGEGCTVTKVGITPDANPEEIYHALKQNYENALYRLEQEKQQLTLQAKQEQIDNLRNYLDHQWREFRELVNIFAENTRNLMIQGEGNRIYMIKQTGDIMESKKEGINVGGNMTIGGDNMTLTGASIIGDLNNVTNTIQQLQDIKTEKTEDLVKILTNLKDSIANDTQLTEPQKKEALEAVQTIAEEAKKPAPERTLKYCSMALNALKGITSAVTDASKLAEVFRTCLPTLTTLLGL